MTEIPIPVKPSKWKKILRYFAAFVLIVITYRLAVVYTIRSIDCDVAPPAAPVPIPPRTRLDAPNLTVMSMNIEGHAALVRSNHIELIARAIVESKADVVGLQEIHRGTWQSRFQDHAQQIADLTGMNIYFSPSASFLGGKYGNAVLTKGKIIRGSRFDLTTVGEPRALVETEVEIGGQRLNVFVSHLATWGSINKTSRTAQLDCIAAHVRASRYPYVLMGDFNATPHTGEIQEFIVKSGAQFCSKDSGPTHRITRQQIDYVFSDAGFEVVSARTLDLGPSDHSPVFVELAWTRNLQAAPGLPGEGERGNRR